MSKNQGINENKSTQDPPISNQATPNPLAKGLNVTVSLPETIEIKMVDASTLNDLEIWGVICAILSNATVGFIVAFFQDQTKAYLFWTFLVFLLLMIISLVMVFGKRRKLYSKSKAVTLKATEVINSDQS